MDNILLLNSDGRLFDVEAIERIFRSEGGFRKLRFNEPGGSAIEADYVESDDSIVVGTSESRKSFCIAGTSDAALRVALLLQSRLSLPLRIVDTDYSFDLVLGDYASVEELRAAIDAAQAS